MDRLFVGVDIPKDSFSAAGLDGEGDECFSGLYLMDSDGFSKFLEIVTTRCQGREKVWVAMESTGCYHINLFSFLTSQGIHALVINPLLIANFAKRSLRKTQTDKKDAKTIDGGALSGGNGFGREFLFAQKADRFCGNGSVGLPIGQEYREE